MEDKVELTGKTLLASIDEVVVSSDEEPIVGTCALATCVGILVYSEKYHTAIAAHVSTEIVQVVNKIIQIINDRNLASEPLRYQLIPGFYYNHYRLYETLEDIFKDMGDFMKLFDWTEKLPYEKDAELPAYQFAFDSRIGEFVSDKVLYGKEYLDIKEGLLKNKM